MVRAAVFRLTPAGAYSRAYTFAPPPSLELALDVDLGCRYGLCDPHVGLPYAGTRGSTADGYMPFLHGPVADGSLYGVNRSGGGTREGTFFRLRLTGALQVLYTGRAVGGYANAGPPLHLDPDGTLTWCDGQLNRFDPNAALAVNAKFSPSVSLPFLPVELSWSSTRAANCTLIIDTRARSGRIVENIPPQGRQWRMANPLYLSAEDILATIKCEDGQGATTTATTVLRVRP